MDYKALKIALFQPDIPQNFGAMIRLCGCLGISLDIIEPCGFLLDDRKIRQAAMDYEKKLEVTRHMNWKSFLDLYQGNEADRRRIVLMTTKTDKRYTDFEFQNGDILLAGRESAGVPDDVHEATDERISIPMQEGFRSLNIVNATAMILGEALRQTQWKDLTS
ncbi:MAG: tRNA (cytidine(34)-2'-O)-methyltransferase [Alphaproteobacteria bacterium]|nr:tRNA (cytidine(34)-2'-O)-methyltransferase [Alphaproteobacteria bacterium]